MPINDSAFVTRQVRKLGVWDTETPKDHPELECSSSQK